MAEPGAGADWADHEHLLRLAMDRSAVATNVTGADGRFLWVNDAMVRLLGRDGPTLLAATWQELTHPDDLAADEALSAELMAGVRDHYRLIKRYLRPDGSVVWGDLSVSCVRGPDGRVELAISQIIDVTEQVQARAAADGRERLLRSIIDDAPVAMGVTTLDGAFVRVNEGMADFFGRPLAEIMTMRWQELTPDAVVPEEEALVRELLAGTRETYRLLKPFPVATRGERWGLLSVTCTRTADGKPEFLIGQIIDVTEQQETLDILQATLASMVDPHVLLVPVRDESGAVVDLVYETANEAACASLDHAAAEVVGARLRAILAGDAVELMLQWCRRALDSGALALDDVSFASSVPGEERWFDVRAVRVGDRVSFTWRDVSARHHEAIALAERETRYRLLAENSTDVIVQSDERGDITWVSPSVTEALGWRAEQLVGSRLAQFVHPDDLAVVRQARKSAVAGSGAEGRVTARFRTAHGGWRRMSDHGRAITDEHGALMGGIDSLRDVQAEWDAEEALRLREQELRAIVDTLVDPWVMLAAVRDREGRLVDFIYTDANEAAYTVNRVPRDELLGRRLLDLLPEHGPSGIFERYVAVVETGNPLAEDDQPFTSPLDGRLRRFDNRAVKVGDGISLTWRDVTERYDARQRLRHLADHDLLTGAANRRLLESRLAEVMARQPRTGSRVAALYCDVDHFKEVNDRHGHIVGDRVLATVVAEVTAAIREGDLVARIGGDEFVIILDGVRDLDDAGEVALKVARAAMRPVAANDTQVEPRLSIGVALADPGEGVDAVLTRADAALYAAKIAGRGRIVLTGREEPIVVE